MKERVRPAPEAIERVRQFGEKKILQFLDEVSLGTARNLVEFLPPVHGFRPQSEAGIKQQKIALSKRLSNKAGGADPDHFALYVMWRAWAWEQLGDPDATDYLLDDLEKSLGQPRSQEDQGSENDRSAAIAFVTGLKVLSLKNKCSREKLDRLLEFSPLAIDDAIHKITASCKSEAEIERDATITDLPNRLCEVEQEIQSIKDRVAALVSELKAATTKLTALEQRSETQNQALRPLADAVDRLHRSIASSVEAIKQSDEARNRLGKRFEELEAQVRSGSTRQETIERRLDTATRSLDEGVRELKSALDPIQHKLAGIAPVGGDAIEAVVTELAALSAKVMALSQEPAQDDLDSLCQRIAALEARPLNHHKGAPPDISNERPAGRVGLSISVLPGASEGAKAWTDVDSIVAGLAACLQTVGLKKSASALLAEEIAAAILTSQVVILKGALAGLVARKCADTLSRGLAWSVSVPIGLIDGSALSGALQSLGMESAANVSSVVIDGINRSALDATKDVLLEYAVDHFASGRPPMFCFATLASGVASLPVEPEYLELGPVLDLDYLDWRISPDASASSAGGVMALDIAKSLWHRLAQGSAEDIDEVLRVLRKFIRKRNPRIERAIAAAYAALRNIRSSRADASPMQSLAYGWLVPLWVAAEVSREDVDSELDGGRCDATSADTRIAAMLGGERFGSERAEDAE